MQISTKEFIAPITPQDHTCVLGDCAAEGIHGNNRWIGDRLVLVLKTIDKVGHSEFRPANLDVRQT
jgi:hypothetical protein